MKSEAIQKLEDEVTAKAIALINTDELAKKMAKKLEEAIADAYDRVLEGGFDFEYWLQEELQNEKTVAGKAFSKAMKAIAKRMAEAI